MPDPMSENEALKARVAELEAEREKSRKQMIQVDRWGYQLMQALGEFIEQCLKVRGPLPLTTSIICSFPDMKDMKDVPLIRLWATTGQQSPVTRIAVVVEQRDAAIHAAQWFSTNTPGTPVPDWIDEAMNCGRI